MATHQGLRGMWLRAGVGAAVLALTSGAGSAPPAARVAPAEQGGPRPGASVGPAAVQPAELPDTLQLAATIRDFRAFNEEGGHTDFQRWTGQVRVGLAASELDNEGKPVLESTSGSLISVPFTTASGDPINPALFNAALGDRQGQLTPSTDPRITSPESFAQWYRDVPGVNASTTVTLELRRVPGTERYVFDSATAQPYATLGGFFPINGQLYGNFTGFSHNFHFTTELETSFEYKRNTGQVFRFSGDDDVWVYIDGKLVIDLGGVHGPATQVIQLDRLNWLEDGRSYRLKVFHAERRTAGSNFRIETTIRLRSVTPPPTVGLYD